MSVLKYSTFRFLSKANLSGQYCYFGKLSSINSKSTDISSAITFHETSHKIKERAKKPLVLLYSWLKAKESHLSKYTDFYITKGFDVMQITTTPKEIFKPIAAQADMKTILDFVLQDHYSRPLFVHGFSVGGYLYGETLQLIIKDDKYKSISKRIHGQCMDSPADMDSIAHGTAHAMFKENLVLKKMLENTFRAYLLLTKQTAGISYKNSQDTFLENKLRIPSLFFYSDIDKICPAKLLDDTIKQWKDKQIKVFHKKWVDTEHVLHMRADPVTYIQLLNEFLESINLLEKNHLEKGNLKSFIEIENNI